MATADTTALIALIVSLIALFVAFTQLLQSSALSAEGWRRCNSTAMGKWSVFSRRKWLWSELRCEVKFTLPEIGLLDSARLYRGGAGFVQPDFVSQHRATKLNTWIYDPGTKFKRPEAGIVHDAEHILCFNSLPNNIEADWDDPWMRLMTDHESPEEVRSHRFSCRSIVSFLLSCLRWLRGLHFHVEKSYTVFSSSRNPWNKTTATTWNSLLRALFTYQLESWLGRKDDPDHLELVDKARPRYIRSKLVAGWSDRFVEDPKKQMLRKGETIVCLELKRQSWDSVPPDVVRPLARSTLSTLVILARRLGMRWVLFDLSREQYRAEGNGCSMSAVSTRGLGLVFRFDGREDQTLGEIICSRPADKTYFGIIAGDPDLNISDSSTVDNDSRLDVDGFLSQELGDRPYQVRTSGTHWNRLIANDMPALLSPFMPLRSSSQCSMFSPIPTRSRFELLSQLSFLKAFGSVDSLRDQLNKQIYSLFIVNQRAKPESDTVIPELVASIATNSLESFFNDHAKRRKVGSQRSTQKVNFVYKGSPLSMDADEVELKRMEEVEKLRKVHVMATEWFQVHLFTEDDDNNGASPIRNFQDLVSAHMDLVADCYFKWFEGLPDDQKRQRRGGKDRSGRPSNAAESDLRDGWDTLLGFCTSASQNLHVFRNSLREMWDGYQGTPDDVLDNFWWVLVARGVAWQMSVKILPGGSDNMVPSSIYGSKMPVWIE